LVFVQSEDDALGMKTGAAGFISDCVVDAGRFSTDSFAVAWCSLEESLSDSDCCGVGHCSVAFHLRSAVAAYVTLRHTKHLTASLRIHFLSTVNSTTLHVQEWCD